MANKRGRPPKRGRDIEYVALDQTVRSHFEILFRPQKLRFKSPETVYRWRLELDRFDLFLRRPAVLPDLTDMAVGDATEWLLSSDGPQLSVESARAFLARIRKLWDFLARKRIVNEFPVLENLAKKKSVPKAWTRDELSLLWNVVSRLPGRIGEIDAKDWWASFVCVMWRTSERPGAMIQSRPEDLDLRGGFLTVPPENRKGGRIGRVYRLTPDCLEWLERIRPYGREYIWPWPHDYNYLWGWFKEILRCAGLPFDRASMFSRIRKSHASHLKAAGGNATESLGHASSETTDEHYLDPRIICTEWPAERLFGLDGRNG